MCVCQQCSVLQFGELQPGLRSTFSLGTHAVSESLSMRGVRCPLPRVSPLAALFTSLGQFCQQNLPLSLKVSLLIALGLLQLGPQCRHNTSNCERSYHYTYDDLSFSSIEVGVPEYQHLRASDLSHGCWIRVVRAF